VRCWLRLDPERRDLRLVVEDLFDGRHTRTEYRCIGDDGGPLRGSRWDYLDGKRVECSGGRFYFKADAFGAHHVQLDLERHPVIDERQDCRLFDRRGERVIRNRVCPHCREAGAAWEETA
jgi:hypothetical protein